MKGLPPTPETYQRTNGNGEWLARIEYNKCWIFVTGETESVVKAKIFRAWMNIKPRKKP